MGQFENGKMTGKGRYIYQDRSIYEGGLLDHDFHGQGVYQWATGEHENEWEEGK
jgi:hypothetical protein